jgi:4-hydroxybenzoate polyprenyl transferase
LPLIIVLFFVGAFVMRGAGCTWNDITDRDLDALVERTRSRPIPAGQVSVPQAAVFLVAQALIGLAVLLQFNRFAVATGIASLLIVAVYPFMKRITWWPQIVLGLAFSWGALMGFAVTFGRIDAPAVLLYAGSIAWVIGYDTIYAHQDAEDDALIGIKSTALLFGARTHQALLVFYALAVVLIGAALVLGRLGFAGVDRACRIRRASDLADQASGHQRSRFVPADFQVQPRCGAVAVCRIARGCGDAGRGLIPGDDLAFALMDVGGVEQVAAASPHQEFRTPGPDRIVPPPPRAPVRGHGLRATAEARRCRSTSARPPRSPRDQNSRRAGCSVMDRDEPERASGRRRCRAAQRRENR